MSRRAKRNPELRPISASTIVLGILTVLFVAMRLFTAWIMRFEVNGDLAIVQMMVRDMASGGPIPAFFSGQAYMGSLEPIANAVFHLLFGRTNFGTALGTAFFMALAVIAVARMARRAGGEWAAVAALAFLVLGPMPFVHYAISPRGGYGVLLFTTAALLDVGAKLICEERDSGRCGFRPALMAGLLVGIGFWCNQLVFPATAAVAFAILLFAPRLLSRPRLWFGGIIGFAIGSAPFWTWNARNGWESFQMAGSLVFDYVVAGRNLTLLVAERWPALFGVNPPYASRLSATAIMAASVILPALALRVFAPLPRRIHPDERPLPPGAKVQLSLCLFFLAFFLGCFLCSHFALSGSPRYLLPVVPVFAVLAGAACTSIRFRSANFLGIALLSLLVVWQFRQLPNLVAKGIRDSAKTAGYREAAEYLAGKGTDVAYCAFRHNSLNLSGGGVAFTDSNLERVPAFRRRAELADTPAVVDDFLGIARWAVASGGSICATNVGGLRIATDIVPPPYNVVELPIGQADVLVNGHSVDDALNDRDFVTAWELDGNRGEIEISLGESRPVCGVRCLVSGFDGDGNLRVFGRDSPDAPFHPLAPSVPNVACRWSGPRFYPDPFCQIMESRFQSSDVESVRIVFNFNVTDGAIRKVREVQVLTPSTAESPASPTEWHAAVGSLVDTLRRHGVNRLYASRWIANAVSEKTDGSIWTNYDPDLHPKATGAPNPRTRPKPVVLDGFTALLVSPSGAPAMRIALEKSWIKMREVHAGSLGILFITESIQIFPQGLGDPIGFIFDPDCPAFFPSADWEELVFEEPPNVPNLVLPDYPPTVPWLRLSLELHPTDNEAVSLRQALDVLTEPMLGGDARFADIHVWRGVRVLDYGVRALPGGFVRLRHYWSSPRRALPDGRLRAFVHFIGPDGYRFQDDFALDIPPEGPDTTGREEMVPLSIVPDSVLNGSVPHSRYLAIRHLFGRLAASVLNGSVPHSRYPVNAEVLWHVDRRVAIPEDAPPGIYEMRVGLYDAVFSSKRLHIDTRLPHRRNAVITSPVFAVFSKDSKDATP